MSTVDGGNSHVVVVVACNAGGDDLDTGADD